MKTTGIILALLASVSARHHHHKQKHVGGWEKSFIQIGLDTNQQLLSGVESKLKEVEEVLDQKALPSCDEECQKKCDASADENIRLLKNPLTNITWNCKNNYHVYTTDYDPDHSHFDRISSDVMDVQRVMNEISRLEAKIKGPYKNEGSGMWNDRDLDV